PSPRLNDTKSKQHEGSSYFAGTFTTPEGCVFCWTRTIVFVKDPWYVVRFTIEKCKDYTSPPIPTLTATPTPLLQPPLQRQRPLRLEQLPLRLLRPRRKQLLLPQHRRLIPTPTPTPTPTVTPTATPTHTPTPDLNSRRLQLRLLLRRQLR